MAGLSCRACGADVLSLTTGRDRLEYCCMPCLQPAARCRCRPLGALPTPERAAIPLAPWGVRPDASLD